MENARRKLSTSPIFVCPAFRLFIMLLIVHDGPTRTVEAVKLRKLPKEQRQTNWYYIFQNICSAHNTDIESAERVFSLRLCWRRCKNFRHTLKKLLIFCLQEPTVKRNSLCE